MCGGGGWNNGANHTGLFGRGGRGGGTIIEDWRGGGEAEPVLGGGGGDRINRNMFKS